ncbi:MAG: SCO family protein [Janthinobacterium lividum]
MTLANDRRSAGNTVTGRTGEGDRRAVAPKARGRWTLVLLLAVCIAPVLASYFTYYVIKPAGGSTNYGSLIAPQRPLPSTLALRNDAGQVVAMPTLKGKWLMLSVDASACDGRCLQKLYYMRQVRLTQNTERDRVQVVWLRTDDRPVPQKIRDAYGDAQFYVADAAALGAWLRPARGDSIERHIYLVDPNGNLMMQFPDDPDPSRIKQDLTRLLKWSGIG